MQSLGLYNIQADLSSLADGHSIASYLATAAGLLTSTTIGAKEHLDALDASSHLDSSAYATGVDFLSSMGVVNNAGNWVPLTLNAAGELPVSATVNAAGDYAEDSPHVSGDVGLFSLAVRRDARSAGSDTDGDYSSINVNAVGELWVKDADALAQLVLIKSDTAAILADTATIDSQTLAIQNLITALSKTEDAVASSGDQGIQALAVRKDSQASNAADGDYTSLQTWSEGSLKVVDVANGAILQSQVSVTDTAAALPVSALANRKSLMIQNTGANKIWIGSATVTTSGATAGIEMPANSFMELEVGPAVSVFGIKVGATGNNVNLLQMA